MRLESRLQELENPDSVSAPVTLFDPYQSQVIYRQSGQASGSGSGSALGLSSGLTAVGMGGGGGGGAGSADIGMCIIPVYNRVI